jgi:hypothetical protein
MSFVIIDLKYNEHDGVKICEMQPASYSEFIGYDHLMRGSGLVPELFCNEISKYQTKVWFMGKSFCDKKFVSKFREYGWKNINMIKELNNDIDFIEASSLPVDDPYSILDYHGILYVGAYRLPQFEDFRHKYPGILVLDVGLLPYFKDKYVMDQLLKNSPKLGSLRPASILCQKQFSKDLIDNILQEIKSELLVIKPINASQGKGVIIVDKNDLGVTLEYILTKENKNKLEIDRDRSYNYWANDRDNHFLIEEFIESDHVNVPQFDNLLYDGTMRVVALLLFQHKKVEMVILEGHWKLPKKSVSENGSLNEKHKSYAKVPHFHHVNPQILEKVKQQLSEGFDELYSL